MFCILALRSLVNSTEKYTISQPRFQPSKRWYVACIFQIWYAPVGIICRINPGMESKATAKYFEKIVIVFIDLGASATRLITADGVVAVELSR